MKFFKNLIAATLGTLLALFLVVIVLFISIISSSGEPEPYIRSNSILKMEISGNLPARAMQNPLDEFLNQTNNSVSIETLKENLSKAAVHDNIKGVLLEIDFVSAGWANLEEAHRVISAFRDSSDKFIYAKTNDIGYNEQGYFLATAADSVFSPPESFFEFDGFLSQITFYTGLFEKIGIEAEIARHGKYKSAVEPYYQKELSEESEYQLNQLIGKVSSTFVNAVHKKSGKTVDEINALLNEQPRMMVSFAYENNLVDSLLYDHQLESLVKSRIGIEQDESFHMVSSSRYAKVSTQTAGLKTETTSDKIAVIYASGIILPELNQGAFGNQQGITASFFEEQLKEVREDDDVKALVIRVNSPGGSGSTSDEIWNMIEQTKKEMPVIVSMGPTAASGGYYIAMAADSIVAEPTTVTGSIGVFSTKFNAKQLFNEELGITFDEVKSHNHADWLLPSGGFSPAEEKAFQQFVDTFYDTFITKVANARGMTKDEVDSIAQGRVWTGADAKEQNLVDVLGGMDKALAIAAEKAGIEQYDLSILPKKKDLLQILMGNAQVKVQSLLGNSLLNNNQLMEANNHLRILKQRGVLALLPYEIAIQ
ncbi:MAG: signal peptide peptidase SppA [Balneolaceae bacterium]|nr:signal peptide peptidase SppA [Balneolaceae bacterium]